MTETTETSFVYYLMSNASMNVFSENKPQHFRTLLPSPLNLDGVWEVGLSAIMYPHNWNNIKSGSAIFIDYPVIVKASNKRETVHLTIPLLQKQFQDLDDCIRVLNETINSAIYLDCFSIVNTPFSKVPLKTTFTYDYVEFAITKSLPKKVFLKDYGYGDLAAAPRKTARGDLELWRLLGFDDSVTTIKEGTMATHSATTTLHFPSLYVYTPMIEYVGVGDTRAPLFAVVPIKGKPGEMAYERFDKPIYNRVTQKFIPEIEISIKDDTGDDVQFGVGKTILILHFRRRT